MRIAYAEDDLLPALLVQFATRAIAEVFANEFERGCGVGNAVLEILGKYAKRVVVGDLCKCGGLFGHFLSQFQGWGRRIIHFYGGGFDDSGLAAVKIVDAHLVAIANALGDGAPKIWVKSVGHRFLDCNATKADVLATKDRQIPRRFALRYDKEHAETGTVRSYGPPKIYVGFIGQVGILRLRAFIRAAHDALRSG